MDRKRKNRIKTEVELTTLTEAFRKNPKLQWHIDRGLKDRLEKLTLRQIKHWWSNHKSAEKRRRSSSSSTTTTRRRKSTSSVVPLRQTGPHIRFEDRLGAEHPQMEQLEGLLKGKDEEIRYLKEEIDYKNDTVNALVTTGRKANDELLEARKALIKGLRCLPAGLFDFGVRGMGQLDCRQFLAAFEQICRTNECEYQAAVLCSRYEKYLRDPSWQPYKTVGEGNSHRVIMDKEDVRLRRLRKCYGDELYSHVAKTLLEINEYNPSGRSPVPELWNFKENRKAHLWEVSTFLIKQWKESLRREKTRTSH